MSENILYKFAKDLGQLYANTQVKGVENCFVKVAEAMDLEVEKWLQRAVQINLKAFIDKPEILDTLVLLARLKKTYPVGISYSELTIAFMKDTKLRFFLPYIISLREASATKEYAILAPYKSILEATRNMSVEMGEISAGAVSGDIDKLDQQFREELNRQLNNTYESHAPRSRKRITKKERLSLLLNYLTRRFSEEVSIAFESMGELDTSGIAADPTILRNPVHIIKEMFPSYPPDNIKLLIKDANDIVKQITKYSNPSQYDFVYNYLRNTVMHKASIITKEQFNEFSYQYSMGLGAIPNDDDPEETNSVEVPPSAWNYSHVLILLSLVLHILGTKTH